MSDEINKDTVDYRDPTPFDDTKLNSITEISKGIRHKLYGKDVREAIAQGIERTYEDASKNGNANMEVEMARGTEPTLNDRLDKMDDTDAEVTAKLAQKAKQTDLETERSRITNLATLTQGSTTGDAELIDARTGEDGLVYGNLGSAIRSQFANLPFDSISELKTIEVTPIWTSGALEPGGVVRVDYPKYSYSQNVLVKTGDVVTVSSITSGGSIAQQTPMRFICAYNGNTIVSASGTSSEVYTYTVPNGITSVKITCDTTSYNSHIIKVNGNRINKIIKETALGSAITNQFANLPFDSISELKTIEVTPIWTSGALEPGGAVVDNTKYSYSQNVLVKTGDVVTVSSITSGGSIVNQTPMRFICAYNGNTIVSASGISSEVYTYTVPNGITSVKITCDTTNYNSHVIKVTGNRTRLVTKNQDFLGSPIISGSAASMTTGNVLELEENSVSKNKYLSFSADITTVGKIRIGHGKTDYNGSYIEITPTQLIIYNYSFKLEVTATLTHGLTLSNYVKVNIKVGADNTVTIKLTTSTGTYTSSGTYWKGRHGKIFAEVEDCTITNVKMNWFSDDYKKSIYAFGDSYFEVTGNNRWTAYLIANGYDNLLLDHYSGRTSLVAYQSFLKAIEHGKPQYALWCMGMNDPDSETAINSGWKTATDNFIARCLERKITPILCTIPNVKGGAVDDTDIANMRLHNFKNAYVKASGYRYIDFYKAVGADNVNWYPNMLYSDGVHPDVLGADALYMQALIDFPELMQK